MTSMETPSAPPSEACLNCGETSPGARYCPRCGQAREEPIPSVSQLLHHFFDDVFSLDSKITRTFVPLIAKPGWLTTEYLQGRKVHYLRPLRLYLVLSLVHFVLLGWFGEGTFVLNAGNDSASVDAPLLTITAPLDSLATAESRSVGDALRVAEFDESVRATLHERFVQAEFDSLWIDALGPRELDTDEERFAQLASVPLVGGRLRAQAVRLADMEGETLAQQMNASIFRNLPKGVFLLVPVFALVLRLFYLRRKRRYAEHFVFALHVHAFAFLILSVSIFAPWRILEIVFVVGLGAYLLFAMKRVYEQGLFKTLLKFVGLLFVYGVLLAVTVAGTALFSALTL